MSEIDNLKEFKTKMPPIFRNTFIGKYGKILDLMTIEVQPKVITNLAQFYDPLFKSFLFQDFQLTHTLEDERILELPL